MIRFLSRHSEGLRLAATHGGRSAIVCEYAYRNEPHGTGAVGRWIDRRFLHQRGWCGARARIDSTRGILLELLRGRRAGSETTMILDVAAGAARYLRDLAREHGEQDLVIICHDRDPRVVMHGRQLIAAEGLPRFTFSVGDATDDSSYLTSRDPDVILAIGLFSQLPDDAVRTVMELSFRHLAPGGCFVCTTLAQSDGSDVDAFGARPVTRHPDALREWLRAAGFVKIDQRFSQPHGFALIGWKPPAAEHR